MMGIPALMKGFGRRASQVGSSIAGSTKGARSYGSEVLTGSSNIKEAVKKHPFLAGLGILGGGMIGSEVVGSWSGSEGLLGGIRVTTTGKSLQDMMKVHRLNQEVERDQSRRDLEYQQVQQQLARNAARLAASNPHLYNQIMAGRRLPQGAVILGGTPRTDLMEEIAGGMATQPQMMPQGPMAGPQDQFLSELGV